MLTPLDTYPQVMAKTANRATTIGDQLVVFINIGYYIEGRKTCCLDVMVLGVYPQPWIHPDFC